MSNLTRVYCWLPAPGNIWRVHERSLNIIVDAESKEAAIAEFNRVWAFRAPVEWIYVKFMTTASWACASVCE
jgi:hypothetical protein